MASRIDAVRSDDRDNATEAGPTRRTFEEALQGAIRDDEAVKGLVEEYGAIAQRVQAETGVDIALRDRSKRRLNALMREQMSPDLERALEICAEIEKAKLKDRGKRQLEEQRGTRLASDVSTARTAVAMEDAREVMASKIPRLNDPSANWDNLDTDETRVAYLEALLLLKGDPSRLDPVLEYMLSACHCPFCPFGETGAPPRTYHSLGIFDSRVPSPTDVEACRTHIMQRRLNNVKHLESHHPHIYAALKRGAQIDIRAVCSPFVPQWTPSAYSDRDPDLMHRWFHPSQPSGDSAEARLRRRHFEPLPSLYGPTAGRGGTTRCS
ncbi:unnamed protein product [Parajaminaea phylloscopi]